MPAPARVPAPEKPEDVSHWLTRRQASDLLGVAEGTLINWEKVGILHPKKVMRGTTTHLWVVYDPDELLKCPRRAKHAAIVNAPGELSARAFEMFDNGQSVREVVIALRETSQRANELYDQWIDDGGSHMVISPAAKIEIERFVGPFKTVAELCEILRAKLAAAIEVDAGACPPAVNDASDARIERAIHQALDAAEAAEAAGVAAPAGVPPVTGAGR